VDVNSLRIAVTVIAFAAFLWIVLWAYLPSRKKLLDEHARRILEDRDA
jgi:F0F1-type ATP synthase membrane subunit b/b'